MSKAHSPTENIFALLALADEPAQKKDSKPSAAPKKNAKVDTTSKNAEPTPAARAEARKQQEAEAKAKQKADDERKAADAERQKKEKAMQDEQQKAFDALDSTGFSKQRAQAKKDKVRQPDPVAKPVGKGQKRFNNNNSEKQFPKEAGAEISGGANSSNSNNRNRQQHTNFKGGYNKPNDVAKDGQTAAPGRKRDNDKHSGTGRAPGPKKGGHGPHNWDDGVAAGLAIINAGPESPEVQGPPTDADWDDVPVAAGGEEDTTATAAPEETTDATTDTTTETPVEEPKELGLDEHLALQAEKRKQLEAVVKPAQPRALTEAEKQNLAKFTIIENSKAKKPVQPAAPKPATTAAPSAPAAPGGGGRKGQTPVALDSVLKVYTPPREGSRDGPRYPRGNRDGQRNENSGNKNTGTGTGSGTGTGTGAPRENRGPPRQRNQNFNNSPAQQNRGPRDNRAKKDAPPSLTQNSEHFDTQFPSL